MVQVSKLHKERVGIEVAGVSFLALCCFLFQELSLYASLKGHKLGNRAF